jgi:hypothetical protein
MARQSLNIPLRKTCSLKKPRYHTQAEAERALAHLAKNDRVNYPHLGPLVVYKCEDCECYHVGHKTV